MDVNVGVQPPNVPTRPPNNNMVWGILTTILCCLPFGIVSIVYASKVNNFWLTGYKEEAMKAAKNAKNWALAAAITGVVMWLLYIIFASIFGLAIFDIIKDLGK